jgi:hypothetical protein
MWGVPWCTFTCERSLRLRSISKQLLLLLPLRLSLQVSLGVPWCTFTYCGLAALSSTSAAAAAASVTTGEFGCAMVYLHEIAPARAKGLVGSIGFASAMVGCMLGVLVVVIVEAIFTPGEERSQVRSAAR